MAIIIDTRSNRFELKGNPDKCPFCHIAITPTALYAHSHNLKLEAYFLCPNQKCNKGFLGYYNYLNGWEYNGQTTFGTLVGREFSEEIRTLSQSFVTIYNQAFAGEQQGLIEICGVGFRKALEFLIKEYAIVNCPTEKEKIEKKLLGQCISEYVDDARIKAVAKRAVWLGNDETHYIRKWEGKNLNDLKKLIDLTVHWIEMESLTKTFELEMPD